MPETTMTSVKQKVFDLITAAGLGGPYWLSRSPFLQQHGWFRSFITRESVDAEGQPVPWWSYSFTRFLEPRLTPDLRVFEYGSGASTLWLSKRVASIVAVEHSAEWARKVQASCPANARVVHTADKAAYLGAAEREGVFDIVIVDGEWRVEACQASRRALSPSGVLILDDTERPAYAAAAEFLSREGFRALAIGGIGALSNDLKETSIFYRPDNCLRI